METSENSYGKYNCKFNDTYSVSDLNKFLYSLGYNKILEDLKFDKVSEKKRKKLILVTDYLRVVVTEAMKSTTERELAKLNAFLNMALREMDLFYLDSEDGLPEA